MKILITGTAGFIGYHLVKRLVNEGYEILGIDNINEYYDVSLKYARLRETGITVIQNSKFRIQNDKPSQSPEQNNGDSKEEIEFIQSKKFENYRFVKMDLQEKTKLNKLFETEKFDYVVNLAAQAGVRYSITNPQAYIDSNITGFFNILECCSLNTPKHLIFASSSSVYGNNKEVPFSTEQKTDEPISLYAATKKSNEVMAYAYSSLYGIPTTGLRFFTVYGPWGRPDMAYYSFSKSIIEGKPINVYNNGDMLRDFTYIDDIVESIKRLIVLPPDSTFQNSSVQYNLFNIGNSNPVNINVFIRLLEKYIGKTAYRIEMEMQMGDMYKTFSDTTPLYEYIKFRPEIDLENGLKIFSNWFLKYRSGFYG